MVWHSSFSLSKQVCGLQSQKSSKLQFCVPFKLVKKKHYPIKPNIALCNSWAVLKQNTRFIICLITYQRQWLTHLALSRQQSVGMSKVKLLTLSRLYDVQCHCSRALPLCSERTWFIMNPSRVYPDCDKEIYTEGLILEKQVLPLIREKLHHSRERRKKAKGKESKNRKM